ncbi:hypothetical protein KGF56_001691 [Candida oxycetoniae]|uniref:Palmitoyltransferase n=1 Tax=Candida oxycetoniae TaxID=497107 RepID=A0AAI9SYW3_9ASCO|nr:uncharacterized protein KGF56_001691 [Candida oxycetoniae]KAI3405673.2 hypothetical protein KGF56_001691 [Candida oxycetoniae]
MVLINIVQAFLAFLVGYIYTIVAIKASPFDVFIHNGKQGIRLLKLVFLISICSSLASPIGYKSLTHLDYLAYLLAKSCKLIPVMFVHFIIYRTQFPFYKYVVAGSVTLGVTIFTFAHTKEKNKLNDGNTLLGLVYLIGSMLLDGLTNSTQDQIFKISLKKEKKFTSANLMCTLNLFVFLLTAGYTFMFQFDEIKSSWSFANKYPELFYDIIVFAGCGAIGQVFIFIILEKFDSIVLITATVTRKMLMMCFIVPKYIATSLEVFIQYLIQIFLYCLCIYTYYKVIYVGPGSPLDYPQLRGSNSVLATENPYKQTSVLDKQPPEFMTIHTLKVGGTQGFRYCNKCDCWKPDRTHHCSSSGKCILKMDHYCPWFFVSQAYQDQYISINLIVLCALSATFALSVTVFACFSLYLASRNLTTIEFQEQRWNYRGINRNNYEFDCNGKQKKLANIFDLGLGENLKSTLGTSWKTWLFPIDINKKVADKGFNNGINFRVNEEVYQKWCNNTALQNQLNAQLRDYSNRLRRERDPIIMEV